MPALSASAGEIFYLGRGTHGPPLVCIHGAGGAHGHWGYQLRGLSDIAQVYTIDLPGHGRSAPPGRDTIAGYVAAVWAFVDALELSRVVLVGHSMGGAIGLQAALGAPDRVAGLGLVGAGGRLRVAPAILDGLPADRLATIRLIVGYSYAAATPAHVLRQAEQAYAGCDPAVYHGDFLACDAFDVIGQLGAVACPAAVICGTADRMTPPRQSEALRAGIPGATLTLIEGAGHMAPLERPAEVSAALRELVSQITNAAQVG